MLPANGSRRPRLPSRGTTSSANRFTPPSRSNVGASSKSVHSEVNFSGLQLSPRPLGSVLLRPPACIYAEAQDCLLDEILSVLLRCTAATKQLVEMPELAL